MLTANAIALSKCIKRPCMVYEEPLKKADISDVKLSDIIDDMKKTKECPIFDGTTEIEGLLYTEERFRKIARQLQFNTGVELYDNFEEVLRETAEEHWVQITANIAAGARTPATFNNHVEELYTKYVDADARNQIFKYIPHLRKPRNTSPSEHVNRMTTLLRYSNKLPGTDPIKNEEQIKEIIFDSFPMDWQAQFNRSGRQLVNNTMAQVVQFMRDEKNYKDNEDNKRKQSNSASKTNNNQGNKRKNDNSTNNRQDKRRNKNLCKYHEGKHEWKDCIYNPRSRNYKPELQRPYLNNMSKNGNNNNRNQTPPPTMNKPRGYRQGPHYFTDQGGRAVPLPPPPPSYMYLPPAPSAPPCPPNGSIPSDVSWNSYYSNSTTSNGTRDGYYPSPAGWR